MKTCHPSMMIYLSNTMIFQPTTSKSVDSQRQATNAKPPRVQTCPHMYKGGIAEVQNVEVLWFHWPLAILERLPPYCVWFLFSCGHKSYVLPFPVGLLDQLMYTYIYIYVFLHYFTLSLYKNICTCMYIYIYITSTLDKEALVVDLFGGFPTR